MLSNNTFFGTSAFPDTTNIDSGAAFDPVASFQNADLGEANSRVMVIWAPGDGEHKAPIFRIDVITGNNPDRGVHRYTHVKANLDSADPASFYATGDITLKTGNNYCESNSYSKTSGSWVTTSNLENCIVASDSNLNISAKVSGSTLAKGNLNFSKDGQSKTECSNNPACHTQVMDILPDWDTACALGNKGSKSITSNTTWGAADTGCYQTVTIANNRTLTLTDTAGAYRIKNLVFANANKSVLKFADAPDTEHYKLYVENFNSNKFNGKQFFNNTVPPHQVRLFITGTNSLKLNGGAQINADLIAPYTDITINGNFSFIGGIKAKSIYVSGKAKLIADEAIGGGSAPNDFSFSIMKSSQRFKLF